MTQSSGPLEYSMTYTLVFSIYLLSAMNLAIIIVSEYLSLLICPLCFELWYLFKFHRKINRCWGQNSLETEARYLIFIWVTLLKICFYDIHL
jgi:hypothetical protein